MKPAGLTVTGPLALATALAAPVAAQAVGGSTPLGGGQPPVERVLYVADQDTNDVVELFSVPGDGSAAPLRLNPALPVGGDVSTTAWRPIPGGRALYLADQNADSVYELFVVPVDGSAPPLALNGPLVPNGDVEDFAQAGGRVVYRADQDVDLRSELYSVPDTGGVAPTPLTPGMNTLKMSLSRDGSQVLFSTGIFTGVFDREQLWVVPADGSQAPLLLGDSGFPSGIVAYTTFLRFEVLPGNTHAVYMTLDDDKSFLRSNYFAVPLDGSTPPVRLNVNPLFQFGGALRFEAAPDGRHIVFQTDDGGVFSPGAPLWSVRPDGSQLVALTPGAKASQFRLSADGVYAVFDRIAGGMTELVLERLDGTQSLTLLGPMPETVRGFELVPGGTSLVYVTRDASARQELFLLSTPQQPLPLVAGLPAGQGVSGAPLAITPDRRHVVFLGDVGVDDETWVCSVRLDGSQPFVPLNPPLGGTKDVRSFQLSTNGRRVHYLADPVFPGIVELFSAPVDGSTASLRLNVPLGGNRDVLDHRPAPGSRLAPGP